MGCTSSKKEIKQVVKHWMGKEIVFPDNLTMKIYGKDTIDYSLLNHKYKILYYVDTNGCHKCQLKFYEWQRWQKSYPPLKRYLHDRYRFYFTYFKYEREIRGMIYTTNRIEIIKGLLI